LKLMTYLKRKKKEKKRTIHEKKKAIFKYGFYYKLQCLY